MARCLIPAVIRNLFLRLSLQVWIQCLIVLTTAASASARKVEVSADTAHPWKAFETVTLADLPAAVTAPVDTSLTRFGGSAAHKVKATGFFYTTRQNNRWWLVDPEGGLFLNRGVVGVTPLQSPGAEAAFNNKFGSVSNWAEQTTSQLRTLGFNGLGAWSEVEKLESVPQPLPYTRIWNFMAKYESTRKKKYDSSTPADYAGGCLPVFDPEFKLFCDQHARQLTAGKTDPNLIGHFSDNELPFNKLGMLTNYLMLPKDDPGRQAAWAWLRARHGEKATLKNVTAQDKREFLGVVVAEYYRIVSTAIKKVDPDHLFLGSRFHGMALTAPEIFRAAGPYVDVVSVNYYHAWTPDAAQMERWSQAAGKPILVTEWYAKGVDSGMGNSSGAGWLVKTQRDRGDFYENFTLGLLASKCCVGWHWFKYADNDPEDRSGGVSNRDSNKGLFSNRYDPYAPLLESMRRIDSRTYSLINYFDSLQPQQTERL